MKAFALVLSVLLVPVVYAEMNLNDYQTVTLTKEGSAEKIYCPTTKISDNDKCMSCHAMVMDDGKPKWGLKEFDPFAAWDDRPGMMEIMFMDDKPIGYVKITQTGSSILEDIEKYLQRHNEIKYLIIELQTPGGSIMDAWRTVGLIKKMQNRGVVISTRCYGMAASAGAILLAAGDIGERVVGKHAEIMIHKVWTFQMFSLKTPDTAEDQAATLKHFQKNINEFIISRSKGKMTEAKLNECIFKKDFWMTGKTAVQLGLADKLL